MKKKKKVLRKKKKCMTDLTTVTAAPTSQVILPKTQYRSFIGRILTFIIESKLRPSKSNLARIVSELETPKTTIIGSADEQKIKDYASYVVYSTSFGVIPRSIEDWDSLREQQRPTTTQEDSLLHTKPQREFTIDSLIVGQKTKQYLKGLIATGKHLHDVPRFFPSMVREKVGTSNTNSQGNVVKRTIVRVVSVSEDRTGYVWQNGSCSEFLPPIEPDCLHRIEHTVTFDRHVALSASSPFLFRGTGAPLNVEKPINIDLTPGALKITPEWADRQDLNVTTLKPSNKEKVLPFKSRWCVKCEDYFTQSHECQQDHDTHLEQWSYYKTATTLKKARKLVLADAQRREEQRLNRVFKFQMGLYRKGRTVVLMHKAAWVQSFGGLFSHMMRRMTFVADCIVVRDLSTINVAPPSKPYAGDYMAWESSRTCKHTNLRGFTFKDGLTIQMCPDCTKFDEEREDVLKTINTVTPKSSQVREWNTRLEAEGLSEGRASFPKQLLWGDSIDLDHNTSSDGEESFTHPGVNTAGAAGTNRDGEGSDSSSRDRRAKAILQDQNDHVTLTKSICLYCGADIWERKGTHFCPDTDCRQRFQEEKAEIRVDVERLKLINVLLKLKELQEMTK